MMHVAQAQVWRAQCTFHIVSCVIFMRSCCVFDSPRILPFLFLLSIFSPSSCFSSWPSTSSSTMWWTNSLCASAYYDLHTLAGNDRLTLQVSTVESRTTPQDVVQPQEEMNRTAEPMTFQVFVSEACKDT